MHAKLLQSCPILCDLVDWTVAHQAPMSMGFSKQEYWSGLPFPPPGDLPDPGIKPAVPALQADSLLLESPGKSPESHDSAKHFAFIYLLISSSEHPLEVSVTIVIPILQMGKLNLKEVTQFPRSHMQRVVRAKIRIKVGWPQSSCS